MPQEKPFWKKLLSLFAALVGALVALFLLFLKLVGGFKSPQSD